MIKDENKSLSKKQLIEDVKELEIEGKSVPVSLENDLKRATQGMDQDKMVDEAAESVLERVKNTGTSSLDEDRVILCEAFNHRGFLVRLFFKNNLFFGDATANIGLVGTQIRFDAKDYDTLLKCGQHLVDLINTFHKRRYN